MKSIEIPALDPEQRAALEKLYRVTHKARLGTRAQTQPHRNYVNVLNRSLAGPHD